MRLLLLMLGISVCVVGIGTRAEAQNYPWCAIYSGPKCGDLLSAPAHSVSCERLLHLLGIGYG